jgi:2-dehydro-3-deoxyphosphogalactonate aldolase
MRDPLKERFAALLKECPMVAILRGITIEEIPQVCAALEETGVRLLEIPLNTPNALACIARAVECCGDRMMCGAGTVLTPEDVSAVCRAGGQFIISPNTDAAVIRATVEEGMISMPGFLTPSEAFTAIAAGADYLKLFPAGNFGLSYIRNIQAVVKAPILAVGGVDASNMADFLKLCVGVGIGGALYRPGKSIQDIRQDAAAMCAALK